jgi:hypothetical protein
MIRETGPCSLESNSYGVWLVGGWPLDFVDSLGKTPVQLQVMVLDLVPATLGGIWLILRNAQRINQWMGRPWG